MKKKVADLTVEQLKAMIETIVQDTMENMLEDIEALNSENYLNSIHEARQGYKNGKFTKIQDLMDV